MEMTVKKREWVKNAAIIFLAVMLVLTFFSNTIMNKSLPEVATQYVQSGEITSKIRGSGLVTANGSYDVMLSQSREIESVKVKEGDTVKVGDVLFTLAAAKSDELRSAQDQLRALVLAYSEALIDATSADYAKDNLTVSRAKEDLQAAQDKANKLYVTDADIAAAQDAVTQAQAKYDKAQSRVDDLGGTTSSDSGSSSTSSGASANLAAAQSKLANDESAYGNNLKELIKVVVTDRLSSAAVNAGKDSGAGSSLADAYVDFAYSLLLGGGGNRQAIIASTQGDDTLDAVRSEFDSENPNSMLKSYIKQAATSGYTGYEGATVHGSYDQAKAYSIITSDVSAVSAASGQVDQENSDNEAASEAQKAAAEALKSATKDAKAAEAVLKTAQSNLDALKTRQTGYDDAVADVKAKQRALEDDLVDLASKKSTDSKAAAKQKLELLDKKAAIASQQAAIGELAKNSSQTDIKAKVAGVIKSLNAVAGKTYDSSAPLATIVLPDHGYCVSFSVTNEQARKVHAGDEGTVSNYYNGEIKATLQTIKPDPSNPQTNRLLVFDLTGDVTEGTSLSISVGERSAQYDTIVPNSAIRSDSNGDFILTVVSKSSPLGNRYIATRVDIEKVASDDTNTAVSGAVNPNDYVITTSSKPVNNKDHVKLADS
jgi:multidrug efflux pump subunit AcrA (membrane-fusion protein)